MVCLGASWMSAVPHQCSRGADSFRELWVPKSGGRFTPVLTHVLCLSNKPSGPKTSSLFLCMGTIPFEVKLGADRMAVLFLEMFHRGSLTSLYLSFLLEDPVRDTGGHEVLTVHVLDL